MEDKEIFEEIMEEQDVSALINRRNASGSTLLHQACINNSPEKAALLMKKGAVVLRNRENETPYMTLMKCFEEGKVAAFLEKLRAEVDVSGFIMGIQHIVEATDLQPFFEAWALPSEKEKEEAEQKINDFFSETLNVLFIPAEKVEDSKREELRTILKEWNSSHDNKGKEETFYRNISLLQCFIPDIDIIFLSVLILPPDNNTAGNKWSDRQLAAAGEPLTGIAVKKISGGGIISSIRAR